MGTKSGETDNDQVQGKKHSGIAWAQGRLELRRREPRGQAGKGVVRSSGNEILHALFGLSKTLKLRREYNLNANLLDTLALNSHPSELSVLLIIVKTIAIRATVREQSKCCIYVLYDPFTIPLI